MPLLEITQTRQISASVRLDEVTATQVDQYAAFTIFPLFDLPHFTPADEGSSNIQSCESLT